jgi:hypothetical protein
VIHKAFDTTGAVALAWAHGAEAYRAGSGDGFIPKQIGREGLVCQMSRCA